MAKKRNAKNAQHSASRALLMSGLVVAAITGVTPAMAATVTVDNSTTGEWKAVSGSIDTTSDVVTKDGAKLYSTTPGTIQSLHVKNAQFYVGSAGLIVHGKNVPGSKELSSSNVLVSDNGKLYVGAAYSTTVTGGDLTADNMSINGVNALVEVSAGKTLKLTSGNLDIIQGTLSLKNGTVKVEKGNVNIETLGTLSAEGKSGNIVDASGSVNLNGGKIIVAKDGGLTIGASNAAIDYAPYLAAQASGAAHGVLVVQDGKAFNSRGGTIAAKMVVTGNSTNANFNAGTTTVDNLTVASGGLTTIAGGATVNILANDPLVTGAGSTLEMKGGTLNINNGSGFLTVADQGTLAATAGKNVLNGSVVLNSGNLNVSGAHTSLDITKNLAVNAAGKVNVGTLSTLKVDGNLTTATGGSITVTGGTLIANEKNVVSWSGGASSGGIATDTGTGSSALGGGKDSLTLQSSGNLLLTGGDKNFKYTLDYLKQLTSGSNTWLTNSGGTVGLLYGTVINASGGIAEVELGENGQISVPNNTLNLSGSTTFAGNATGAAIMLASGSLDLTGTLTLSGTQGGKLVTNTSGGGLANVAVSGGTLNLGIAGNDRTQGGSVGNITLTNNGQLNVAQGTFTASKLDITSGAATITSANFATPTTVLNAGGSLNIIGTQANQSTVDLGTLTATGGKIFIDPAYANINHVSGSFNAQALLGAGGVINIGANDSWLRGQMTQVAQHGGTVDSVLGLRESLTLGASGQIILDHNVNSSGSLVADGTTSTPGTRFGAGSLLVIDSNSKYSTSVLNVGGATGINAGNNVTVHETAQLRISNALATTYTIVSGASTINSGAGTGWNGANLSIDTDMLAGKTTFNNVNGTITTKFDVRNASDVYTNLDGDMAGMINSLYLGKLNGNVDNPNRGIAFLTRATRGEFLDKSETARVVEGAARMGAIAGVQTMTMTAATAGTSAATSRTAMASPLMSQTPKALALNEDGSWTPEGVSAGDTDRTGVSLWIMPLYQSANKWGMKAGEFKTGLSGDLGGVAIGADYTIDEAIRVGLAFNMGGGYAQSKGDFSKTDNNFNFWGVNLYGGWTQNNFGLTADVGYTSSFNAVKQELPSSMQMGELKADVTSTALTAGLRGEYKFETESVDIIPHVGVRFMSLDTYEFDTKSGGTVFKNDQTLQNIWTFPIGVTFAKDITSESGWNFKPQVDLQVIPAAGDVKAKSKVKVAGLQSAELNTRIMDDISYGGGIGLNLQKDNISFGVNYNILMGEHTTDHGVYGTFRYEF